MAANLRLLSGQMDLGLKLHSDVLALVPRRAQDVCSNAAAKLSMRLATAVIAVHILGLVWILSDKSEQILTPKVQEPITVSLLKSPAMAVKELAEMPLIEPSVEKQPVAEKQTIVKKQHSADQENIPVTPLPAKEMVTQELMLNEHAAADVTEVFKSAEAQSTVKNTATVQEQVTKTTEANPQAELQVEPPKFGAAYLNNPAPEYPALARRKGEQGRVMLKVLVSETGLAQKVQIDTSSGYDKLDQAAVEAVKKWSFIPARRSNQAVSAYVLVPIKFSLNS